MKNKMGLSTCFYKECTEENWRQAAGAGFTDTELVFTRVLPAELILSKAERAYNVLSACRLHVSSVHLPFNDAWDISALETARRREVLEKLRLLLDWTGKKQIGIAVLHPSFEPVPEGERQERLLRSAESIRELSRYASNQNIRIAVENLPRTCLGNCADEILTLTDDGKSASVCFDVNHLLKETHRDFVKKAGDYFITTHFSDYDRRDEKHWLPGDGCIDWKELMALLEEKQYGGRYLFELNEASSPSLNRVFTPKELADRFREITT